MIELNPVPKWKIGCLKTFAILWLLVIIGFGLEHLFSSTAQLPPPTKSTLDVSPVRDKRTAIVPLASRAPDTPKPTLTDEHKFAIRAAIIAEGLPTPNYLALEDGIVEIQYHATKEITDKYAEHLGMTAVKAARNTIYVRPDADKNWWYNVTVWGPSPGPDMDPDFMGSAFMSSNLYRWSPS